MAEEEVDPSEVGGYGQAVEEGPEFEARKLTRDRGNGVMVEDRRGMVSCPNY